MFSHGSEEKLVTPQTAREALQIPSDNNYNALVGDADMRSFLTLVGYEGSLTKLG